MKTKTQILILTAILASTPAIAMAGHYVVGISPNYTATDRETVFKATLQFILDGANTNDGVVIYDALNLRRVAVFKIPGDKIFDKNPRARVQRLASDIAALRQFLGTEHPHPEKMTGVIHTPEFLALAGSQLREPGHPLTVILIAAPFYMSMEEPAFDQNDAIPSDAHISSSAQSPFSTVEIQRVLQGVTVHYGYLHNTFVNAFHEQRLERFNCLFVQEAGGTLATWAPELDLAFERAKQNARQPCMVAQLDANDTKVEMRRVTARSLPSWMPPTNQLAMQSSMVSTQTVYVPNLVIASIFETNAVTPSRGQAAEEPAETDVIGIAIYWTSGCDFDLYVKPGPTDGELNYRNTKTPQGHYFHDYRGSGNDKSDFEFVQLKADFVDVRQIRAWVNFYGGHTESPIGIVVVHYQGRTYESAFSIKAKMGNQGRDSNKRTASSCWAELGIQKILGIK